MTNAPNYSRAPEVNIQPVNPVETPDINLPPLTEHETRMMLNELQQHMGPLKQAQEFLAGISAPNEAFIKDLEDQGVPRHQAEQQILNRPKMLEAKQAYQKAQQPLMAAVNRVMGRGDPTTIIDFFHSRGAGASAVENANVAQVQKDRDDLNNKSSAAIEKQADRDSAQRAVALGLDIPLTKERHAAAHASIEAGHAARKHSVIAKAAEQKQGWGNTLTSIGDLLAAQREQQLQACRTRINAVGQILEQRARLTQEIKPADSQQANRALTELTQRINQLSPRDPERAQLVKDANQLMYRLKQREISTNVVKNTNIEAFFTEDGGIMLNPGTAAEKVIYDNGDVSQTVVDSNGQSRTYRMKPDGTMRHDAEIAPIQQLPENPKNPHRRNTFPSRALAEWDKMRNPRSTAVAHAELRGFTRAMGEHEAGAAQHLNFALGERQKIANYIQAKHHQIGQLTQERTNADNHRISLENALNNMASNDPKRASFLNQHQAVTGHLHNLQNHLVFAQNEMHNAHQHQALNEQTVHKTAHDLTQIRERMGVGRYWQGVLESRMAPPKPHRKKGLVALMGKIKAKPQEINPSPDMLPDGSVVWRNLAAHDTLTPPHTPLRMGAWRYRANGRKRQVV